MLDAVVKYSTFSFKNLTTAGKAGGHCPPCPYGSYAPASRSVDVGEASPVCSHVDLPLDSANQLSQQIKSSTYIVKQNTICRQSAYV